MISGWLVEEEKALHPGCTRRPLGLKSGRAAEDIQILNIWRYSNSLFWFPDVNSQLQKRKGEKNRKVGNEKGMKKIHSQNPEREGNKKSTLGQIGFWQYQHKSFKVPINVQIIFWAKQVLKFSSCKQSWVAVNEFRPSWGVSFESLPRDYTCLLDLLSAFQLQVLQQMM